jgi:RNA polymerase sigma-70 factor (ECF subfamily)
VTISLHLPASEAGPALNPDHAPPISRVVSAAPERPASTREDRVRLAGMLQTHYRTVWRTLRRLGVPPDRVDDAAQEVYIVAARKLDLVEQGCERKYLLSTAVRVAANYRRARAARPEISDDDLVARESDPAPAADHLLDQKRMRQLLDEVLDSLSRDLRTVFVLFELEGLSVPEIADLTGAPIGTVASRLRRARAGFQAAVRRYRARHDFSGVAR